MRAKNVEFEVTYVNLREKPDWFLEISPHGKVPVLKVDDEILFESNAIAEYLDEVIEPKLHPATRCPWWMPLTARCSSGSASSRMCCRPAC